MTYSERLKSRLKTTGSALCVGLDPRPDMTDGGVDAIPEFLRRVIGETAEFAAAFKPNIAYFEAMGLRGLEILDQLLGSTRPWNADWPSHIFSPRGQHGDPNCPRAAPGLPLSL